SRGAGPAVGLNNVAVNHNGILAQCFGIDDGAQAAADESRDFLGATRDFATDRFSCIAIRSGTGQHRILCGNPTPVFTLQPTRHTLGETSGAQDLGITKRHDGRAFGVSRPTGFNGDIPKLGYGAIIGTSGQTRLLLYGVSNAGNGYGQLTVKRGAGLLGGH